MKTVDFYFDFSSTNSYFAAFMLPEICERAGALVIWRPTHFAALFRGAGFDVMAMTRQKARYLWRDHERYAEFTGLPFRRPTRFPIKTSAALRIVLAAGHRAGADADVDACERAKGAISQAIMRAYWERDEDIADRAVLRTIAAQADFDADAILDTADSDSTRRGLAAATDEAIARGVFGAPTSFVGGEMFWGKDRLDFVERYLKK
ncbi:MAG: 2-hydroxychromene-2-carboxylate isomerase [Candidatus Binatus sp.]|uniref:2-hydroxychromene-2-carboxylate isomerase n=1 Tax=Candidatus Binatus sp. TaxID=2811406 RepID=UPI002716DD70|nr:2-hydroxychromene-2-carboxylate isomerase [Candidatus Binatus sp.]MDO8433012.1 2-hydroxychromene-2-carboxylate isomerase [Candidatus Binatus sp.]